MTSHPILVFFLILPKKEGRFLSVRANNVGYYKRLSPIPMGKQSLDFKKSKTTVVWSAPLPFYPLWKTNSIAKYESISY